MSITESVSREVVQLALPMSTTTFCLLNPTLKYYTTKKFIIYVIVYNVWEARLYKAIDFIKWFQFQLQ